MVAEPAGVKPLQNLTLRYTTSLVENNNANALSRAPIVEHDNTDDYITAITDNSTDNMSTQDTHTVINQDHHELINLQQADVHLRDIIHEE